MANERRAGLGRTLNNVEDPGRQPGLRVYLSEFQGRERRLLGRFENHRIAAGQRRSGFPHGDLDRVVPGADAGTNTDGFPSQQGKSGRRQIHVFAAEHLCKRGKILDDFGAGNDIDDAGFRDGFTRIERFELGQFRISLPQQGGCTAQYFATLGGRRSRP